MSYLRFGVLAARRSRGVALLAAVALVSVSSVQLPALASAQQDCEQSDDLDLQVRGCSDIVRYDDRAVWAYVNRSAAYVRQGRFDRAIVDASAAITLDPSSPSAYMHRGRAYRLERDYARAIADFSKAIEIDPSRASAYVERSYAHERRGKLDDALADLSKAAVLEPDNLDIEQVKKALERWAAKPRS